MTKINTPMKKQTEYTLYVKIHMKTGLRYLGQTSKDPFKYSGSGIDWKSHLTEFGNDVHTEILLQTADKSERNLWGRYYSALWHVVTAADDFGNKIWANRIPETGGGDPEQSAESWKNDVVRKNRTDGLKNYWDNLSSEAREIRVNKAKLASGLPESREKLKKSRSSIGCQKHIERLTTDPDMLAKKNAGLRKIWADGTHKKSCLRGKDSPKYNHEIFEFVHLDGTSIRCTMYELCKRYKVNRKNLPSVINGTRKTCNGWKLSKAT